MDRLLAMQIFARVVELGSFAAAAKDQQLSRARTSEAVQALESALGTRLLHRTTRRLALTDDGRAYYERVSRILWDVSEAEAEILRSRGSARGRLRVDVPVALGRMFLLPALPALFRRYPELEIELRLENRSIDLTREGVDCAVSYGEPLGQEFVVRRIADTELVTCAAPGYFAKRGAPREPRGLAHERCVAFLSVQSARPTPWEFVQNGARVTHEPRGNLAVNTMEACVDAAAAGLGITQVLSLVAYPALAEGKLEALLGEFAAPGPPLFLVYPPNQKASARLRAFTAFISELFRETSVNFGELARTQGEAPTAPLKKQPSRAHLRGGKRAP